MLQQMKKMLSLCLFLVIILAIHAGSASFNAFRMPIYTIESSHFKIHFTKDLHHVAERTATILEELYTIYRDTYDLTLPEKTDVLVANDVGGNGWAMDIANMLLISPNAFDFNLRGTHHWLRDVVTHEYAHIVSITASHKMSSLIPYFQFGAFSHPNEGERFEGLHIYPLEILPPWFFEGIAQYESFRHGSDRWDSHRDMIVRTLSLSSTLLPYDHMYVFAGRGDDYEKTYNHGFSLVKYIAEEYGYDKVVAILRESSRFGRINFDRSIKNVLGIRARELYKEWKQHLEKQYKKQIEAIGPQVYGTKINKKGYDNYWPRFSPDEKKIYFISNGEYEYSLRSLYSYNLVDTVEEDKRIKPQMHTVKSFYSLCDTNGLIAFSSAKSRKSMLPLSEGAKSVPDIFIDTLPPEEKKFRPFHKTERQVTEKRAAMAAAFSPSGDMLAFVRYNNEKNYLCMSDTSGENVKRLYPDSSRPELSVQKIFSLDWSPEGNAIAISYIDNKDRKIGIFDTSSGEFSVFCDTEHDERDPRFSRDGKTLYFSSDRTGIFNIYRYHFDTKALQRITNVSGGAFAPDITDDESMLVYANYDKKGYGIYLIDSITAVEEFSPDSTVIEDREPKVVETNHVPTTPPRRYSFMPRKLFLIPTLLGEEVVSDDDDVFRGKTALKAGVVLNLFDPYYFAAKTGSALGGYLLLDPAKIHKFIDPQVGFINPEVDYDLGFFGETNLLPTPIQTNYSQRSITGKDEFYNETQEELQTQPYNVTYYYADIILPYYFMRGSITSNASAIAGIYPFASLNRTDVAILLRQQEGFTFQYNIGKGHRIGAFLASMGQKLEPTMRINPKGSYLKVLYSVEKQKLIDDENAFGSDMQENYDSYLFHSVKADIKLGFDAPWYKKHSLYAELGGMGIEPIKFSGADTDKFPYYYEPAIWWHPGYAYYTQEEKNEIIVKTTGDTVIKRLPYLKGVVAGNAVTHAKFSYRFPLWPGSIERKLSFIYFDRLYGAFNVIGGAGWDDPAEIKELNRDDWLLSYGAEIRLEAQTFSRYPLALKLKWDRGIDRGAPVGGDRFTVGIGFSFDNWEYIEIPDYISKGRGKR
ncbi:MAG: hypothetical protein GF401_09625 [Chitinivibrionales bacterium]|nr:hypothetical protein [Chitinivibrionales bacterium]